MGLSFQNPASGGIPGILSLLLPEAGGVPAALDAKDNTLSHNPQQSAARLGLLGTPAYVPASSVLKREPHAHAL